MTQLLFSKRALIVFILVGLIVGTGAGLAIGWLVWPVQIANVDLADLNDAAQADYILLVAKTFADDQDLSAARERLARLNRAQIEADVAALTQKYKSADPEYGYLANLAIALGSTQVKVAQVVATEKISPAIAAATLSPTESAAKTPTLTPTMTATLALTPTAARAATRTPTRRPTPTATKTSPPAPAILPISWLPAFPQEWPGGVYYQPVNVAAGQKFWHLTRALYCDIEEARNDCKNLPGGDHGIGIWVLLSGSLAPMVLDGAPANLEDKSSDAQCQCTYVLPFPDGKSIQVGNFPSDKIGGLALSSVKTQIPQTHVRYFLTFQLVTR